MQAGQDGLVDVTYRQKYVDGGYSGTEVVDTRVVTEMIPRSTGNTIPTPSAAAGPRGHHGGKQRAQQLQQNVFHEGDRLLFRPRTRRKRPGPVLRYFACDPTLIPYGTKVYITSADGKFVYGWAIATDTGAFVQSNRMQVDLFYETYAESVANGVKYVNVYVP